MQIIQTKKFSVIDGSSKSREDIKLSRNLEILTTTSSSSRQRYGIFLDIDEPYTRHLIQKAFQHASREPYFDITLGPGIGWDPVSIPSNCSFQWSEYERIDWYNGVLPSTGPDSTVRGRSHGASSYCIRKGLSRKAQLAYYTHRHVCKNPDSILGTSIPQTIILDCWSVWDDDDMVAHQGGGLADVVVSIGSTVNSDSVNRRIRLDKCLAEAKVCMEVAEATYQINHTTMTPPVWILKGSTTNKGAGIFIVHLYEQVVDHCWSESDIREWYVFCVMYHRSCQLYQVLWVTYL